MTSLSGQQLQPSADIAARPAGSRRHRLFARYLSSLALVTVLLCAGITTLNWLVDPLWFRHGNRLTGENFIFNERVAKLNLVMQDPQAYDCLIFGSSRVTLLDQRRVAGHHCANLAFSAGNVVEFVAYARYLAERGLRPKLVIVGVDDFNFLPSMNHPPEVPEFVRQGEAPPGMLRSYLSLTALDFSLRTLRRQSPVPRYYDEGFIGRVLADTPPYRPPERLEGQGYREDFQPRRVALYRQLRDAFPEAEFWGYVPPVSAWEVAKKRLPQDKLDDYLDSVTATAGLFDRFYDFSVPSATTSRRDNTFDGSHYYPRVNAVIAERLQADSAAMPADGFGLPVLALGRDAYGSTFKAALDRFLVAEFPEAAARGLAAR